MSLTVFDMSQANLLGYIAAAFVFVTFWMKTMVPLRVLGIGSNIFFIAYGYLAAAYPPLLLHLFLLPLNIVRLREMMQLIKQVEKAASGDLNMAWPYGAGVQPCRDIPRPPKATALCYHANPIEPGHPGRPGCAAIAVTFHPH